ncbi:hypothetical protein BDFB_008896 [Asbolus verrucosus]|uniref:Uncharacterized protein n=1 Tax=Asbolus verrucosus TaxID=1661398 RepID=A0A482VSX6_ASBVE|nr:hypothetical protein BDFB_008896 [Asbolus verrucosus]
MRYTITILYNNPIKLWNQKKFHPGCIVGKVDKSTRKVPVCFYHNDEEVNVHVDDIIYHHSNLMMVKVSFCQRDRIYTGTVYGNDSPKHHGEPRTFFVRTSKKEMMRVPLRQIFLTKLQARKLLHVRPQKKCK